MVVKRRTMEKKVMVPQWFKSPNWLQKLIISYIFQLGRRRNKSSATIRRLGIVGLGILISLWWWREWEEAEKIPKRNLALKAHDDDDEDEKCELWWWKCIAFCVFHLSDSLLLNLSLPNASIISASILLSRCTYWCLSPLSKLEILFWMTANSLGWGPLMVESFSCNKSFSDIGNNVWSMYGARNLWISDVVPNRRVESWKQLMLIL